MPSPSPLHSSTILSPERSSNWSSIYFEAPRRQLIKFLDVWLHAVPPCYYKTATEFSGSLLLRSGALLSLSLSTSAILLSLSRVRNVADTFLHVGRGAGAVVCVNVECLQAIGYVRVVSEERLRL